MNNHLKGLLIAFFGIVILTPDAVLVRLADSDSWTVLFWRGIFFASGIIVILLITYRSKAVNELISIGKGGVLIGILTALGGTSFILAIHYTTIAKTLVIISTSPIMVAIISLIMLKEKPEFYTWLSMIIVFIGIYIVMAGDSSGMNLMGNFFALASVIIGGFSFTLLRKYKNVNIGRWFGTQKSKINSIEDETYKKLNINTIIKNNLDLNKNLNYFAETIHQMREEKSWTKEEIVNLFHMMIPDFGHMETGKYLDGKM